MLIFYLNKKYSNLLGVWKMQMYSMSKFVACYWYVIQCLEHYFSLLGPPPPLNVAAYNTSSTSVMVTWQRPRYPNGIIRGYQISYTPQGGNAQLLNTSGTNSSTLLTGLQIYKVYNVSVRVLTVAYSNFSSIFTVSTDEGGKHKAQRHSTVTQTRITNNSKFHDDVNFKNF